MCILGSLPESIRTLHLGLEVLDQRVLRNQLKEVPWELFDHLLSRLPHLERVEVFWEDRHDEWICAKLPSRVKYRFLDYLPSIPEEMFSFDVPKNRESVWDVMQMDAYSAVCTGMTYTSTLARCTHACPICSLRSH